ncbi:MAG: SDR family NAD(P)-dependent oxidoreductase [Oceanospirillaceae bacterium]|nr:SDR family NAD(P)-dependent oxidoreductase [Oceanospirillaceae bacterium]
MISLQSFGRNLNAVVVGASGGIGSALVCHLLACHDVNSVTAFSRSEYSIDEEIPAEERRKLRCLNIDLMSEGSIIGASALLEETPIDLIIVATGILHSTEVQPEKSLRTLESDSFSVVMQMNALAPMLVAKHFLPRVNKQGKSVFVALSARVGSISDNRLGGWYSYRASKAALNMLLKTFSVESRRTHPHLIVAGLHPGTVNTRLSQPFQRNVDPEKLFSPPQSAGYLLNVIDLLDTKNSGGVFAWDRGPVEA